MTVHAPAERPRILAELAERPGRTAYEVAAALGYSKPDSRRINEIVRRLWNDGALVAGSAFRPALGREARIYYIAPPGTRPRLTAETREQAERRRASNRASKARTRARAAGKPVRPRGVPHLTVLKTAAASLGRDSERAACRDADPDLFFGPGSEWPKAPRRAGGEGQGHLLRLPDPRGLPRGSPGQPRTVGRLGRRRLRDRARPALHASDPAGRCSVQPGLTINPSNAQKGSPMTLASGPATRRGPPRVTSGGSASETMTGHASRRAFPRGRGRCTSTVRRPLSTPSAPQPGHSGPAGT